MESSIKVTLADWQLSRLQSALYVLCGSLFIAACSQVCITLPFTMVPFTFQAQAVLVMAAMLRPSLAVATVAAYLMEGSLGAPVFAEGHTGLWHLFGSTGGYLLAYLPVSYFVSSLFHRSQNSSWREGLTYFTLGNALVFLGGWAWLSFFVGPFMAFQLGVMPFLVTDILKIVALVSAFPLVKKLAQCL